MSQLKRSNRAARQVQRVEHVQTVKVNFWGMIQNVATHAMNKGQFLAVGFTGLIALIIWRAPQEFAGQVLDRLFRNMVQAKGASYILNVVLPLGWLLHVRWVIRSNAAEIDRIGREKTQLQEQITNRRLASPHQNGPHHDH